MGWIALAVILFSCGVLAWRKEYWRKRPLPTGPDNIVPAFPIGRMELIFSGIAITLSGAMAVFLLTPSPYNWLLASVVAALLGPAGIQYVPIGSRGVPTFLGGRLKEECGVTIDGDLHRIVRSWFEIGEGLSWLPCLVMSKEAVDTREQTTPVASFTVISSNQVRITVKQSAIRWRVTNPAQRLSVSPDVITRSLVELVQQGVRTKLHGKTDEEAVGLHEDINHDLQNDADKRATDWGVDVIQLLIGEFERPEEVQKDYERRQQEKLQRQSEGTELDFVQERIGALVREVGVTPEVAAEIVQIAQGKGVTKQVLDNRYSVSPATLETALAVLERFRAGRGGRSR